MISGRNKTRVPVVCLLAALALGCSDASSDPTAVILEEEARSLLATEADLPSIPVLAKEADLLDELESPVQRWSSSWSLPAADGRPERQAAYALVVARLAPSLGRERVGESLAAVAEALAAAATLGVEADSGTIGEALRQARNRHADAEALLSQGRLDESLTHALEAADLLREIGPESVSRMLLARAETQLEQLRASAPGDDSAGGPPEQVNRGRRLIRGAHEALEEGDYMRAIRRAFYACQVLGVATAG